MSLVMEEGIPNSVTLTRTSLTTKMLHTNRIDTPRELAVGSRAIGLHLRPGCALRRC